MLHKTVTEKRYSTPEQQIKCLAVGDYQFKKSKLWLVPLVKLINHEMYYFESPNYYNIFIHTLQ